MTNVVVLNPSAPTTRTPEAIASEINTIKGHAQKVLLVASIEVGRLLVEAKAQLPHGEWGRWLKESVDYSQSTANNLMNLYKEYGDGKLATFGNLTHTKALALLSMPAEERAVFAQENDIENMTARELQDAIKERDAAIKQAEEAKRLAEQREQELARWSSERQELANKVQTLSVQLSNAQSIRVPDETVLRLQRELEETRKHLAEAERENERLQEESSAPITIEPAVVHKVPVEVEMELEALRAENKKLSVVASPAAEAIMKFRVQFSTVVEGANALLATLASIKDLDPEEYEKYRNTVPTLFNKIASSV